MWVLKKNLLGLALVVGAMCSAFAASVAPLRFDGISNEHQQEYWDYLLRYKLWGTTGVSFGTGCEFGDELGWTGTATGDLSAGARFKLGGPIIVGADVDVNGDDNAFYTGPLRASNFSSGARGSYAGQYCVLNTVNANARNGIAAGMLRQGAESSTGACAFDKVPETKTDLKVPIIDYATAAFSSRRGSVVTQNREGYKIGYIDVPAGEGPFDVYYNQISIEAETRLFVRMPPGGRLTRVFVNSFSLGNHVPVQVIYVGAGSHFDDASQQYTSLTSYKEISNDEYAGNLLFYFAHDFSFGAGDSKPIQGTYICKGTMTIANQALYAGQLIAENLKIGENFRADDFVFVPFDPPIIDFLAAANFPVPEPDDIGTTEMVYLSDGNQSDGAIKLDRTSENDITFKYCFKFEGADDGQASNSSVKAGKADVSWNSHSSDMPLCSADTSTHPKVTIKAGDLYPSTPIKVWVYRDGYVENDELFTMHVYDIKGSIFRNNLDYRDVGLFIKDKDAVVGNHAPNATGYTATISENAVVGTQICKDGSEPKICDVQGTDDDGDELYYDIVDNNINSTFAIDHSSGLITLAKKLDYETYDRYPLSVMVSDGNGGSRTVIVTVIVTDVSERPSASPLTASVDENSPINTIVGTFSASDFETSYGMLTWKIKSGNSDSRLTAPFKIVGGTIYVNQYPIDYENKKKYTLAIEVCDDGRTANGMVDTLCTTTTATINVNPIDEAPIVTNDKCEIVENTTVFTKGCQVTGSDPEKGSVYYSLETESDLFDVDNTGTITVKSAPDYEKGKAYDIVVIISDGALNAKALAHIDVIDVNEEPEASVTDSHVMENQTVDVVAVIASDEEDGYNLDYRILSGTRAGVSVAVGELPFGVETGNNGGRDGIVYLTTPIDYESFSDTTQSYYELTIQVCDKGTFDGTPKTPQCVVKDVRIKVDDGPEPPTATGFTVSVNENTTKNAVVGSITGTDPEGETLTYSIIDGKYKAFSISADGKVMVAVDNLDFESLPAGANPFIYVVKGVDPDMLYDTALVTITVIDINEGAEIDDATMTVVENQPKGTTVGTLELYDPDQNENFRKNTFTAIGGDKTKFTIDANTGVIKTNDVFDYETQKTYTLVVQVKDPDGNADTATVTINISDVKETSKIVVTYAETGSGSQNWTNPTGTLYTNENSMLIQWTADGKQMPDTLVTGLKEGFNVVTLTYKDPTKNSGVTETVGIFVSTRTPEVTVTTAAEHDNSGNIFTLVETPAEGDTSVYVNKKNNDIVVTVKEPVLDESYTDSSCNYETRSFTVNAELEPVTIPSNTYEAINNVMKAAPVLNENPISEVTYSQYNGDQVKVSYTEKVAGVDVVISYVTDKNGNVEKIPVIGANGKIDSIEVITVSYQVNVGGKTVNVSYMADAATGQALKTTTVNSGSTGTANAGTSNSGSNAGTNSGSNGGANGGSNAGTNSGSNGGANSSSNGGANGGSSAGTNSGSNGGSGSGIGNAAPVYAYSLTEGEVLFSVTYDYATKAKGVGETTVQVSYTVDQKGKVTKDKDGNVGYEVSYTYVNEMGNSSTQSVYIVVDLIPPTVKILSPEDQAVLHSNMVEVQWCVDLGDGRGCQIQDSLTVEGLQPGEINEIVRFYRDKAGNEASAVVYVMAKNTKDVDITVEKPVTNITKEDVDKYYASKKPEEGQTFAVSIYNPQADKEIETQVGGSFKNKAAKPGEEVYPGLTDHLGPTLGIETKVPVINSVGGLATLDDLVGSDGLILLDAVDAVGSKKVTVEEFVEEHCSADFKSDLGSDISKANIYDTKMSAKIWIYTSLGQFVDYFSFTQDLNDPSYASDAGVLTLYFEMKPDENGDLHTDNGRLYATGAYVYKTEFTMKSTLRCDLPPFDDATNVNKMNQSKKVTEDLLKSFGYKRPKSK